MGQVAQEGHDFFRRLGHLGHHRHLAKVLVAQQARLFLAQRQNLTHHGTVVELAELGRRLVAGARGVGLVKRFAQRAAFGKLHHWQVAGHFQAQAIAGLAFGFGLGFGRLQNIGGNAHYFVIVGVVGKGVGGVQGIFAEFLAQLGLAFLDFCKTLFGRTGQLGT